jgi:hypothetical protein
MKRRTGAAACRWGRGWRRRGRRSVERRSPATARAKLSALALRGRILRLRGRRRALRPPHPAMEPLRRRQAALGGRCSRQARMPRHLPSRSLLLRAATALPAFHGFLPAPEGVPSSPISPARSMPRSEEKWGTNRSLPGCLMDGCDLSFLLLTLPHF